MTRALVGPCDIGDASAVAALGKRIVEELGSVEVLVNSAATNVPRRGFDVLSLADYHAMIQTNLNGADHCTQVFLPPMRVRGSGTIINMISEAGKAASPKSGPGYVMSKFGLARFTQAINAKEREHGIRAARSSPVQSSLQYYRRSPRQVGYRSPRESEGERRFAASPWSLEGGVQSRSRKLGS